MSKKRIVFSVTAATIALFSVVWITLAETSGSARADSASLNTIVEKAQINSLPGCYKNGLVKHLDTSTLGANGENIIANDKIVSTLPGYARGGYKDLLANCRQILFGGNLKDSSLGRFSGLYDIQNTKYKPEDFGYQPAKNSESYGKKCLQATFSLRDRLPGTNQTLDNLLSNIICVPVDSSDNVISDGLSSQVEVFPASGDHAAASLGVPTYIGYLDSTDVVGGIPGIYVGSLNSGNSVYSDHAVCYSAEGLGPEYMCDMSWSAFRNNVKAAFEEGGAVDIKVNEVKVDNLDSSSAASSYELDNTNNKSAEAALKYIKGNNAKIADFAFAPTDWAVLYKYYYDEIAKKYPDRVTVSATECSNNKNQHVYAVTQDGGTTWCKLDIAGVDSVTETFAVRDNDTKLKPGKFSDVITGLMNLDYSQVDKDALVNGSDQNPSDSDGTAGQENPCMTAAAALGWIICPVIQGVGNAVEGVYSYLEDNYLQTNADYISSDSGTHEAWTVFRDLTNIIFAIALVIIILSQVTGIGVSNYGIKKTLPRLIIVIVMVNVSFLLCQLAVDASNLVGYGLRRVFNGLGSLDSSLNLGDGGIGNIVSSILPTILTAATGFVAASALLNTLGVWIWGFLLTLLGVGISILFFFILLGVRQAAIIILVAIAPVAIVCYALPNTKSAFSRWWKMFFGMLLVYPICGLLMGGGQFASRLLLSNLTNAGDGAFFYILIAMLIQAVPFFFVPSIVKSSFAAMGNLGMKLSNIGRGLSKTATGAIRSSDGYKDRVSRGRAWDARRALGRSERTTGVRGLINSAGARVRGGNNRVSRAFDNAYNRRKASRVGAIAAQRLADQNAKFMAEKGLAAAERRQNDEMMKNFENNYNSDLAFATDFRQQESAYSQAIDNVSANPTNQTAIANLRALQNVLGKTSDGQDVIQRTINRKLGEEQATAKREGRSAVLSDGLRTASQTLMNDHGGFKSGNRALSATLKDMNKDEVFNHGDFMRMPARNMSGDAAGFDKYVNSYYDAQASKGTAAELAGANDDTLLNLRDSISNMDNSQLAATYQTLSEAITNDNITVKPETEKLFNSMRQEIHSQMMAGSTSYYDTKGREFKLDSGSGNYTLGNGSSKRTFTRNATGDLTEVGGAGEVVNGSNVKTSKDYFADKYGKNYRNLTASDTFKVDRGKNKVAMPAGWTRDASGNWINITTGSPLSPSDAKRAEQIETHNIQVDIDDMSR